MRRRHVLAMAGLALIAPPLLAHRTIARRPSTPADAGELVPRATSATGWRTLRIGAGGFIVGLDMAPDGSLVVRTDTYGAWIWEPDAEAWRPLITIETMPPEDRHEDSAATSWPLDVVFAPSRTDRLYMGLDGWVYRTDDRGRSWIRTAFPRVDGMGGVANHAKVNGRKMAVDPRRPDVVCVGAPGSPIRLTDDGGATWRDAPDVPLSGRRGEEEMGYLVIFDPSSQPFANRTSVIYAASWGSGVHRSGDGGATWSPLPDGPPHIRHGAVAGDGRLYVVAESEEPPLRQVFRYDGSSWHDITPPPAGPEAWHSVTVSPRDPRRLVAAKDDGSLCESLDRGGSWQAQIPKAGLTRLADDIPWLAWTDETWMSNGDVRFHPTNADELVFAQGIGVWTAYAPPLARSVAWTSRSRNIEQLVSNQGVHPPFEGSKPLLAGWDRAIWRVTDPETYPTRHYPDRRFAHCWGIDYASDDPRFLAATISSQQATDLERSCVSRDGGETWTPFPAYPPWRDGKGGKGFIAASTALNLVWAPSEARGLPHFTKDGGATWRECPLEGIGPEDAAGFGSAVYLRRYCVCADRVQSGVFYLLHYPKGLFVTRDGGETWSLANAFADWNERFHSKLRAAPDHAGRLYHTGGHSSAPRHGAFIRSEDAGATWEALPGLEEVVDFAFGKAAPGSPHPSLYVVGYLDGSWGIFQSIDDAATWSRVSDGFPTGSLDRIAAIEADKHVFGGLYVGFWGSGWAYRRA